MEYPPMAALIFAVPALFSKYLGHYYSFYRFLMLLFNLGNIFLLVALSRYFDNDNTKKTLWILGTYIALTSLSFQFALDRFDLPVAFLILLSLYLALVKRYWFLGYSAIWIATLTKIFPVILIPILFAYQYLNSRNRNKALLDFGYSMVFGALVFIAFFAWCGPWWQSVFKYHCDRGLQLESLYSSILLIGKLFGGMAAVGWGHGSYELNAPWATFLVGLSVPIVGIFIIAVYLIFWRVLSSWKTADHPDYLIAAVLAVLMIFVLFNKVFSPQYLLWLFPLAALATSIKGSNRLIIFLWLLTAVITAVLFPFSYPSLIHLQLLGILLLLFRNLLLSLATYLSVRGILR